MVYEDENEVQQAIEETVKATPIVLFVKGSVQAPMCGFSKGVMDLFSEMGAEFRTVDVLQDPQIREGIKKYTSWPTIPQIFLQGEFIGGFDIVQELFEKGELQEMVKKAAQPATT